MIIRNFASFTFDVFIGSENLEIRQCEANIRRSRLK